MSILNIPEGYPAPRTTLGPLGANNQVLKGLSKVNMHVDLILQILGNPVLAVTQQLAGFKASKP